MYIKLINALLGVALLSACSLAGSPSLPAETMPVPGQPDALPASPASGPDQPANAPTRSIGTPVPGWENIPIMPGARDAELEDMVYLYSVDVPVGEVEEYYLAKMDVNGWTLINRRLIETSASAGPSIVLDFQKNEQLLNVMLVNLVEDNATAVILSQLGP